MNLRQKVNIFVISEILWVFLKQHFVIVKFAVLQQKFCNFRTKHFIIKMIKLSKCCNSAKVNILQQEVQEFDINTYIIIGHKVVVI